MAAGHLEPRYTSLDDPGQKPGRTISWKWLICLNIIEPNTCMLLHAPSALQIAVPQFPWTSVPPMVSPNAASGTALGAQVLSDGHTLLLGYRGDPSE